MPKIVDHEQQRRELSSTVASTLAQLGLENTTLRAVAEEGLSSSTQRQILKTAIENLRH